MTQGEKQLLLKDICARLPYGVKCRQFKLDSQICTLSADLLDEVESIEPYLRPMSSMTEEEHGQYMEFIEWSHNDYNGTTTTCINKELLHEYMDFIYSHHLDDNNLIEKRLALEAPEDMYKSEYTANTIEKKTI